MLSHKIQFNSQPTMNDQLTINDSLFRLRMASMMNGDINKDINAECGYPDSITIEDYKFLFEREGLATRFVNIFPEESWSDDPKVYETENEEQETEFEKSFDKFVKERRLWHYLQRLDTLSGIGHYGVLLIGLNDGLELNLPVEGADDGKITPTSAEREVIYLKVFDEAAARISKFNMDATSPRFGMPAEYELSVNAPSNSRNEGTKPTTKSIKVHWSRIIHVADDRTTSDIYGTPRLKSIYNRQYDIRKIAGGSGEMFWKGAFPGFATEVDEDADIDSDAAKEEIKKYQEGLSRILAVKGIKINELKPQISDPTAHLKVNIMLAAAAKGIPYRILMGTEEARLAGSEDSKAWNRRCHRRNIQYVDPFIIRPVVERLIQFGAVKPPAEENDFTIFRPDPDNLSELETAEMAENLSKALASYAQSGAEAYMPLTEYLSFILKLDSAAIEQINKARDEMLLDDAVDEDDLEDDDDELDDDEDEV